MFHGIKYLIVSLVFAHLGFWSGNLFLIAPFPDLCLLVPFSVLAFWPLRQIDGVDDLWTKSKAQAIVHIDYRK